MTVSFTVCQSQPSSVATSLTLRAWRPTWIVAHRAARVVRSWRGEAIRSSSSVHDPCRSRRRRTPSAACARPDGWDGRRRGRSTSSTRAPVLHLGDRHRSVGHPAGRRTVSTCTASSPRRAPPPRNTMSSKSDHPGQRARRVSDHGGPPPSEVVEQPQTGGPPLRARGSDYYTPLISEEPDFDSSPKANAIAWAVMPS